MVAGILAFSAIVATGCTSITPRWDRLPEPTTAVTKAETQAQAQPALANPEGQALQIALQTARLAEQRGMDVEAIAAYEKVRKLQPNQPGVAHALAVLYDRGAMTDAAQREYNKALVESPDDADVLCDYGYFLYCIGDLHRAEQRLRQCLHIDSEHVQGATNLAVVLASGQHYDEAKTLFERAIGSAAAMHNIGLFKMRHGRSEEGRAMIAVAVEQDPSLSQPRRVLERIARSSDQIDLLNKATAATEQIPGNDAIDVANTR